MVAKGSHSSSAFPKAVGECGGGWGAAMEKKRKKKTLCLIFPQRFQFTWNFCLTLREKKKKKKKELTLRTSILIHARSRKQNRWIF